MNTICLTDDESKRLAQLKSGDEFLIIRIVKDHSSDQLNCSYVVGQEIGVRETWSIRIGTPHVYVYKSDGIDNRWLREGKRSWSSSRTMPPEAIKRHLILEGIDCKQVQELTTVEWLQVGIPTSNWEAIKGKGIQGVIDYWNSIHAKPRKQGDIYVVYLYDNTPESRASLTKTPNFNKYHENIEIEVGDRLGYYDLWKGKPLIIHANPYTWIIKGRVK